MSGGISSDMRRSSVKVRVGGSDPGCLVFNFNGPSLARFHVISPGSCACSLTVSFFHFPQSFGAL